MDKDPDSLLECSKMNWIEKERRRRTWWLLYVSDKCEHYYFFIVAYFNISKKKDLASAVGNAALPSFFGSNFQCSVKMLVPEEIWESLEPPQLTQELINRLEPKTVVYTNHLIKLIDILYDIGYFVKSIPNQSMNLSLVELNQLESYFFDLNNRLIHWSTITPDPVISMPYNKWFDTAMSLPGTPSWYRIESLIVYHLCNILLHRCRMYLFYNHPSVSTSNTYIIETNNVTQQFNIDQGSVFFQQSFYKAKQSAEAISTVMDKLYRSAFQNLNMSQSNKILPPIFIVATYSTCTILFFIARLHSSSGVSSDPNEYMKSLNFIDVNINLLHEQKRYYSNLTHILDALHKLKETFLSFDLPGLLSHVHEVMQSANFKCWNEETETDNFFEDVVNEQDNGEDENLERNENDTDALSQNFMKIITEFQ